MVASIEDFVGQIVSNGLVTAEEVRAVRDGLPSDKRAADAQEFARELVRLKKLTAYQATVVYQGKAQSLVLGSYVVLDKLGQGGMGMVFKAEHRHMKRIVALKVLPPATTKQPDAIKRFHREVQAAARLSHPNIVAAFDAGEANRVHFLVMEFVEGSDLSQVVKKQGPLPVEKAVQCILQAGRGLEAAHAAGIVHRDIKPANLLLDKSGVVKILDMGLARFDDSIGGNTGAAGAGMTQTGAIMGTVDYMSPEQALNTKHADSRADIYSLGCSLYYLLTGRVPFQGETLMEKLMAHREQPIPPLAPLCKNAPPALDAVYQKMIAKKPADRYQTISDAIRDLDASLTASAHVGTASLRQLAAPPEADSALASFLQARASATVAVAGAAPNHTGPAGPASDRTISGDPGLKTFAQRRLSLAGSLASLPRHRMITAACCAAAVLLLIVGWRSYRTRPARERIVVAKGAGVAKGTVASEEIGAESVNRRKPDVGNPEIGNDDDEADEPISAASSKVWTPLFNGRDLTGWTPIGRDDWSVKKGNLAANGSDWGWLATDRDYSDFELELEYRLPPGGNSGIFLRAWPEGEISGSQFVEVQLLDDGHPKFVNLPASNKTGGIYGVAPLPQSAGLRSDTPTNQWNQVAVVAAGRHVTTTVNGLQMTDVDLDNFPQKFLSVPGLQRSTGRIGLQMSRGKVEFRNIRVRELGSAATSPGARGRPAAPRSAGGRAPQTDEWIGMPGRWNVGSREITGSTGPAGIGFNTFLCTRKKYRNFEFKCQVRLDSGNSGIQFRSQYTAKDDQYILMGPQVDIGPNYWGSLYGEKTSGMMKQAPADVVRQILKSNDFNDLFVRCVDKHVTIQLNGQTTVDDDFPEIADTGLIGLQLHGGVTEVVFRNIELKTLPSSKPRK